MKKFLQNIAWFMDLKSYEREILKREERMNSDLQYCQHLLLEEATNNDITPEMQGEINAYCAFIKSEMKKKQEWSKMLNKLHN